VLVKSRARDWRNVLASAKLNVQGTPLRGRNFLLRRVLDRGSSTLLLVRTILGASKGGHCILYGRGINHPYFPQFLARQVLPKASSVDNI